MALFTLFYYCYSINYVLILIYAIITYLVLQNKNIPIHNYSKLLVIVGKYSFVWYLVHQNIGFIILNHLNNYGFHNELVILVPMLFTFFIAVIIQSVIGKLPSKIFSI